MPILSDETLDQHALPTSTYGYSAARMDDLEDAASEYTLVVIANDVSSSVADYKDEMEQALKAIMQACKQSPRAGNLLVRLVQFASRLEETHGFKLLEQCHPDDYDGCLQVGGMTALCDATENAINSVGDFGKQLSEQDFDVNAIVFLITDGCENHSTSNAQDNKGALAKVVQEEKVESLLTILIGVGIQEPQVSAALSSFKDDAGLSRYVECKNVAPQTLAKLAEFVSKSISAQLQMLGTGSPSQPLSLKI